MDDLAPSAPDGYSLLSRIGRGASSVVWEAAQRSAGRRVALKLLDADVSDPEALRRFEREREAMTAVAAHPGIVTIFDAGVDGSRPWLAMELCRRGSLANHLTATGPLDLPTALRVLARLANALTAAHARGVVHCDIKPANVMVTDGGEPALGDFGIARVSVGRATTTTVGGFSLDHVAPELLGDGKRSALSDVYSLGTTMWELLDGRPPFRVTDDVSVGAVLTRILTKPLPESPSISDDILALLRSMAAKEPEARPASMAEVAATVREIAGAHGVDLDEPAFPALAPVVEELLDDLAGVDPEIAAASTHLRPQAPTTPTVEPVEMRRRRRTPLMAACGVLVVLAVSGTAFGAYRITDTGAVTSQVVAPPPAAPSPNAPPIQALPEPTTESATPEPVADDPEPLPAPPIRSRAGGGRQQAAAIEAPPQEPTPPTPTSTTPPAPEVTKPGAPRALALKSANGSGARSVVFVPTWQRPADLGGGELVRYEVTVTGANGVGQTLTATGTSAGTVSKDRCLGPYTVSVRAVTRAPSGGSLEGPAATARSGGGGCGPEPVISGVAMESATSAIITFRGGADPYVSVNCAMLRDGTQVWSGSCGAQSFPGKARLINLKPGTSYRFTVRATNDYGSATSNTVTLSVPS